MDSALPIMDKMDSPEPVGGSDFSPNWSIPNRACVKCEDETCREPQLETDVDHLGGTGADSKSQLADSKLASSCAHSRPPPPAHSVELLNPAVWSVRSQHIQPSCKTFALVIVWECFSFSRAPPSPIICCECHMTLKVQLFVKRPTRPTTPPPP